MKKTQATVEGEKESKPIANFPHQRCDRCGLGIDSSVTITLGKNRSFLGTNMDAPIYQLCGDCWNLFTRWWRGDNVIPLPSNRRVES